MRNRIIGIMKIGLDNDYYACCLGRVFIDIFNEPKNAAFKFLFEAQIIRALEEIQKTRPGTELSDYAIELRTEYDKGWKNVNVPVCVTEGCKHACTHQHFYKTISNMITARYEFKWDG